MTEQLDALAERDTTRPAEQQGLFRKFDVRRVDGSDQPGGRHHGCEYFVLDVMHDPHAKAAMAAYARSCQATHPDLSNDLRKRYSLPSAWDSGEVVERLQTALCFYAEGKHYKIMVGFRSCERAEYKIYDKGETARAALKSPPALPTATKQEG